MNMNPHIIELEPLGAPDWQDVAKGVGIGVTVGAAVVALT